MSTSNGADTPGSGSRSDFFQTLLAALGAHPAFAEVGSKFVSAAAAVGSVVCRLSEKISELAPSAGYEQLLIQDGCPPVVARGLATLTVHHGKRRARESKRQRQVFKAIRFLASCPRQRPAIVRCAGILLRAWEETTIVETVFNEAGISEFEFIRLLRSAENGEDFNADRMAAFAAPVASKLTLGRGPKISAPSAAHEFLLQNCRRISAIRRPDCWPTPSPEWVDALTDATGREFGNPGFDSRPARRRLRQLLVADHIVKNQSAKTH